MNHGDGSPCTFDVALIFNLVSWWHCRVSSGRTSCWSCAPSASTPRGATSSGSTTTWPVTGPRLQTSMRSRWLKLKSARPSISKKGNDWLTDRKNQSKNVWWWWWRKLREYNGYVYDKSCHNLYEYGEYGNGRGGKYNARLVTWMLPSCLSIYRDGYTILLILKL